MYFVDFIKTQIKILVPCLKCTITNNIKFLEIIFYIISSVNDAFAEIVVNESLGDIAILLATFMLVCECAASCQLDVSTF